MNEQAQKESTRKNILEAALKRFEHYGFNKTTVEEVAEDAGIGKGTIYIHFKSKKEILLEIIEQYNQDKVKAIENVVKQDSSIQERFLELIKLRFLSIYEYCSSAPHGFELVQVAGTMKEDIQIITHPYQQKMVSLLAQLIKEGNEKGIFNVSEPEKIANYISVSFEVLYPSSCSCSWKSAKEVENYIETLVLLYYKGMQK